MGHWHNAFVTPVYRSAARTLSVVVLCLLVAACVTIAPDPTSTPFAPPAVTTRPSVGESPSAAVGASPTPVSTSPGGPRTPSSGSSEPDATLAPELSAQIAEVTGEIPPIRNLEPLADVPVEYISEQEFHDQLTELQFSTMPDETRAAQERMLKRLGLLPQDADVNQLLLDLYGSQVAAYYRSDTKRFYVVQRSNDF